MATHAGSQEQQTVNRWLLALGRATGLRLQLSEQGLCAIGHASGVDCAIEVPGGADVVYLRTPLRDWHDNEVPGLAEFCLSEHFLGLRTQGASFAIDRDEAELVLWLSRPLSALDEASFGHWLVQFLDAAVHCRQQLDAFCRAAARGERAGQSTSIPINAA